MIDPRLKAFAKSWMPFFAVLALVWGAQFTASRPTAPRKIQYSDVLAFLDQGRIEEVAIGSTSIVARLRAEPEGGARERVEAVRLPGGEIAPLVEELRKKGVAFRGEIEEYPWWEQVLFSWILPLGIMILFTGYLLKRSAQKAGPLSFGKSRAKVYDQRASDGVTFADVAGVDDAQAELIEVVDFLKTPDKYLALGARIPKGVLLVGPPGTGKTLLARAVAGEAGVPFFSISASEFVEMFVGVGASRVRDLFEQAKARAPCIVFIDEIDAVGRSRSGTGAFAGHEEREQTLNQLLAEMDGFDATSGVILMAASNRPEVLDRALLRAGRFDRQVIVDRPDLRGREAIFRVHARKVKLAPQVELSLVARRTPGMVGADIANVINEAALAAARRGSAVVQNEDFEEAIDRLQLGLKRRGLIMNDEEKRRVAHHEAGHTLVAFSVAHSDPVHRVTIIPRSIGALGATLQLPTEERYLMKRDELCDRICVMLGGRAAEMVAFGDSSTGAQNDLERATETARQMVCRFGMSEKLGAQAFGRPVGARFLDTPVSLGEERNFSEETARVIDGEVRAILERERQRASEILERRRGALQSIAARLLEAETLERSEIEAILAKEPRHLGVVEIDG